MVPLMIQIVYSEDRLIGRHPRIGENSIIRISNLARSVEAEKSIHQDGSRGDQLSE
jgi:hypothetical protein